MENPVHFDIVHRGRYAPEHRQQMVERSESFRKDWAEVTSAAQIRERTFAGLPEAEREREERALNAWVWWQMRMRDRVRSGASCP